MSKPERFIEQLVALYVERGSATYGEGVSQLQHALQCAQLAERAGAGAEEVVAALLHDVGHLLHEAGEDAAERGLDTRHEVLGARWLGRAFGPRIREAVRWHVDAKRYLCTVESGYRDRLSRASLLSLQLQGGPMSAEQAAEFAARPFAARAVRLRRWDDEAKNPATSAPAFGHFRPLLVQALNQLSVVCVGIDRGSEQ